ncbi:MAG: sugar transferase [Chloroflexi bacterium]|nr:MAG: sugar transferase [Chloroflexota bacterium]
MMMNSSSDTQTTQNLNRAAVTIQEPRWVLPLLDMVLALVAFVLAYIARYELQILRPVFDPNRAGFAPYLPYAALYMLLLYLNYRGAGLYKPVRGRPFMAEVFIILNGITNATVVLLGVFFLFQPLVFSRLMLIYVAVIALVLLSFARVVRRIVVARLRSRGVGIERALIIGSGEIGQAVLRVMLARKELGYLPVGYLDDDPERASVDLGRVKGYGGLDNFEQALYESRADLVVITLKWTHHNLIMSLIDKARAAGVAVWIVPDLFQLNLRQLQVENLDGIPLLGLSEDRTFRGVNRLMKRSLDIGLIVLASPILLPLFFLVALAIRLEGPGPIIYTQLRVGEKGRHFKMYKFRSMIPGADKIHRELVEASGEDPRHPKIKDDPRITRVGRFIRRTSLDELPNLINVIKGQMSLVGPRPPTPDEVELYEPWHMKRLNIIPGITGLWQVSGRSDIPFEEMCLLDIYYIENWSLRLDLQILLMTLPRVLQRSGAY